MHISILTKHISISKTYFKINKTHFNNNKTHFNMKNTFQYHPVTHFNIQNTVPYQKQISMSKTNFNIINKFQYQKQISMSKTHFNITPKHIRPRFLALRSGYQAGCKGSSNLTRLLKMGSFSIYEQPKWERIVASTQVGFRVSIWVRIRGWIRVRVRTRVRVRVRVRLGLYFGCSYIEKGPKNVTFVQNAEQK